MKTTIKLDDELLRRGFRLRLPIVKGNAPPAVGSADTVLASPVLGAGLHVNLIDRVFLGAPRDEAKAIAAASDVIAARKLRLRKGTQTLESAADIAAHVKDRAQFFFADFLPFLRLLRVVD